VLGKVGFALEKLGTKLKLNFYRGDFLFIGNFFRSDYMIEPESFYWRSQSAVCHCCAHRYTVHAGPKVPFIVLNILKLNKILSNKFSLGVKKCVIC
jgi:hypothetical protein